MPFVIYGDTEAFLRETKSTSSPSSPSDTLLNNAKKDFSISIEDEEHLGMEHFVDFYDDDDEEDCENVGISTDEEVNVETGSGRKIKKAKKSNKKMPDEEPHRKPLHPWLKTKRSEPTQKKARLDLSAFMESNSIQHEHKLVISIHFFLSLLIIII